MVTEQDKRFIVEQRANGVSFVEIGKLLNRSPNTVRMIFERATSDITHKEAVAETVTAVCRQCGREIESPSKGMKRQFCSEKCRYTWYNAKKRSTPHNLVCEYCGREFTAFGNPHKRFCCRQCFADSQKEAQHG